MFVDFSVLIYHVDLNAHFKNVIHINTSLKKNSVSRGWKLVGWDNCDGYIEFEINNKSFVLIKQFFGVHNMSTICITIIIL